MLRIIPLGREELVNFGYVESAALSSNDVLAICTSDRPGIRFFEMQTRAKIVDFDCGGVWFSELQFFGQERLIGYKSLGYGEEDEIGVIDWKAQKFEERRIIRRETVFRTSWTSTSPTLRMAYGSRLSPPLLDVEFDLVRSFKGYRKWQVVLQNSETKLRGPWNDGTNSDYSWDIGGGWPVPPVSYDSGYTTLFVCMTAAGRRRLFGYQMWNPPFEVPCRSIILGYEQPTVMLFLERDRCLLIGYRNQIEMRHMSGDLIAAFNRSSITDPSYMRGRGCFIYSDPSKTLVTGNRSESGARIWDIGALLEMSVPLGFGA